MHNSLQLWRLSSCFALLWSQLRGKCSCDYGMKGEKEFVKKRREKDKQITKKVPRFPNWSNSYTIWRGLTSLGKGGRLSERPWTTRQKTTFNYYIVLKKITTNTPSQGSVWHCYWKSCIARATYTLTVFSLNFSPAVRGHSWPARHKMCARGALSWREGESGVRDMAPPSLG